MGLFTNRKDGGIMDVIRCDEPDYLIWKWHPTGMAPGEGRKENSIRWGSSIRVKPGEVVVFLYDKNYGEEPDYVEGPYDGFIKTANLPILTSLVGLAYNGDTPFQAEVYYINTAGIVQIPLVVPFFDIYDDRFPELGIPVTVRGTVSFRIEDYRHFVRVHKLVNYDTESLKKQVKDTISKYAKSIIMNAPSEYQIPVVQLEKRLVDISEIVAEYLSVRLQNDFGVSLVAVDISVIEIDKTSEGFEKLQAVANASIDIIRAQNEAAIQNVADMRKINLENTSESLRIQREEDQYSRHMQTQTANLSAHQINQQAAVGVAGAEGLGNMGSGGIGGSPDGINPGGMMAGMMLGSAVAQNIVGVMNSSMQGMNQTVNATPPPIISIFVVMDGERSGPYDMVTLKKMVLDGRLTKESRVWKSGMADWDLALNVPELQSLFVDLPPEVK